MYCSFIPAEIPGCFINSLKLYFYGAVLKIFGFLGFYIVKPEYRGKGYGIQIWNAGLINQEIEF
jgi:hypothetical protein